ncbi:hypothetical protein CRG98_028901 [Punica granatum]|uniref:Uncharacterized protein n=1 Tax=Punica granatum TaxID=22663 RepID=A0A2I0J3F2_PUNGR|nr:hypothetical protein CRG98_028901 [Punica granatum]
MTNVGCHLHHFRVQSVLSGEQCRCVCAPAFRLSMTPARVCLRTPVRALLLPCASDVPRMHARPRPERSQTSSSPARLPACPTARLRPYRVSYLA